MTVQNVQTDLLLNGLRNPFFDGVALFSGQFAQEGTLYICLQGTGRETIPEVEPDRNIGILWLENNIAPPVNVPVLWVRDGGDGKRAVNEVMGILAFFRRWGDQVRERMLNGQNLTEIFDLLNEVTPNPWYLCDSSFRIQVIRKDQDTEDMSVIWRYQYRYMHLPIYIVMGIEENGLLEMMNQRRRAFIVEKPEPFGFTFVSKTIFYAKGILGHFYILGVYTRLSAYEEEIAEFFGNLLAELLRRDSGYLPTMGRYYDNYLIDLLEGVTPQDPEIIDRVFRKSGWDGEDTYFLAVFSQLDNKSYPKTMMNLGIQILEAQLGCKAFLYHEHLVALINSSKLDNPNELPELQKVQGRIAIALRDLGGGAGISEAFGGYDSFSSLNVHYQQACAALQYAAAAQEPVRLCAYAQVALADLCSRIRDSGWSEMFIHPAVGILEQYDRENKTELAFTLRQYLLHEENVVRTAKDLFIHRNSLMYRLDKIQQLTGIDLEEPGERMRLLLTFSIKKTAQE